MDDEFAARVQQLRLSARARARSRPRAPFDGDVVDDVVAGSMVRRYVPNRCGTRRAVFLHGGYGLFGDLDLQDGWCRRLASSWVCEVLAVDYPLAPEHSLRESVDAVERVLADEPASDTVLCGDSAGAALALATAASGRASVCGLMLTNPNIDPGRVCFAVPFPQ